MNIEKVKGLIKQLELYSDTPKLVEGLVDEAASLPENQYPYYIYESITNLKCYYEIACKLLKEIQENENN